MASLNSPDLPRLRLSYSVPNLTDLASRHPMTILFPSLMGV